ncbi:MAG TPA: VCBS repeat-containing protein [Candidatus Angelobacter sp.]|nr:VCBS repeat-containing protein [Candidatus Angelobacter sp.]
MFVSRLSRLLTIICLLSGAGWAQLTYKTTSETHFSANAQGLAVADFNRDGRPDFAVIWGSTLSVQFNQGAGVFGAPHNTALAAGSTSVQMLAADMNNDGSIDLVIAQSSPMQVLVLPGNNNGTFQTPLVLSLVNPPHGIALGDFNKDGKLDLAVEECQTNTTNCDVAIFLGNGTGTFTPGPILPTPGGAGETQSVVAADLNKDGNIDLAVAGMGGASTAPTMHFTVFFGNGNGTFRTPVNVPVPFTLPANSIAVPPSIVAGDFVGNAAPSIGVETGSICGGSACGQSAMNIFVNNGAGGFTLKQTFTTATVEGPARWQAADLNNDRKIDLVRFSGNIKTGGIETWLNNGSGFFTSVSNPNGAEASFVEVRDMDLDGRHDLVIDANGLGESASLVDINSNGSVNCAPPPSGAIHAKLCTPGSTTSSTTFTVRASGNSPVGVQRLELWVDGTKRAQILNDQLLKTLTLSAGTHSITIVAVDRYLGISKTTRSVTVP